ncbi:hypothetical protein [Actinoallomurus soli]|uniref:hypothetical protein n=1 Tax=Actinoallomurus soli TaxID=2952535 RepID=UPI0020935DB8|nr:hypothetical protein [Actinoallomurus soli]MCO5968522.1 hypothetical protein [Actinoallomurus soli]
MISRRFPGLVFWFGRFTRSWWALVPVPVGWRLVEAADADDLTRAVLEAQTGLRAAAKRGVTVIDLYERPIGSTIGDGR